MLLLQNLCEKYSFSCKKLPENKLFVEGKDVSFTAMMINASYVLEGRLCTLPKARDEREALCKRLCGLQLARLKHEASMPVIPSLSIQDNECFLQCRIDKNTHGIHDVQALDDYIESFCNALATWKTLAREAPKPMRATQFMHNTVRFVSPDMLG
ncbi:MAG: hypothetical protein R3Y11_03315 [Pseudomonadota bacterium]